jgi:tripartite-type tricarboxylate transporter receptor subunit TctC
MPDLPTLASSGIDYDVRDWHGLVGPAGMAPALVTKINNDVGKVLAMPEIKDRITAMTGDLLAGTPADFKRLIAGEAVKWRTVVRQAKITSN